MPKQPSYKHDSEVLLRDPTEVPYSPEVQKLADRVFTELDDSPRPTLEHAGMMALGIQLYNYANGRMGDTEANGFLRMLVDKKTPAPVQRIEQHTQMDMRVLLTELIDGGEKAHLAAKELAADNKLDIMARYDLDETLQLPHHRGSVQNSDDDANTEPVLYTPGDEPAEIRAIRREEVKE